MPFQGCKGLKSITIPEKITTIARSAFKNCIEINEIICTALVPPTCGTDVFSGIDTENCILKVNGNSISDYKTADQWKDFIHIEAIGSESGIRPATAQSISINMIDGALVITGLVEGDKVSVYRFDGILLGTEISSGDKLTISTVLIIS